MNAAGADRGYYRGRFPPGFFAHLFKAIFKQHHRALLPQLRRVLPADSIVFDVGAHAGQYAKLFARLAPNGFVYAFEPQSYARRILRMALRLNRLKNVAILPFGLGDRGGVALLNIPVKASGSYGFGLAHFGAASRHGESELVAIATIDQAVAALGLGRLDFIKADIEGFEQRMLEGGSGTLARFKPALLIELNGEHLARAGGSVDGLWRMLRDLGYAAFETGVTRGLIPIAAPRQGDVLFLARPPQP